MGNINEQFMLIALREAERAYYKGEVPIGAVLLYDDEQIYVNHNRVVELKDPTAHAEMLVISEASRKIGNFRLKNTKLYVTLEPCPMCISAAIHSRIDSIYFGATSEKWGYLSKFNMDLSLWNHKINVYSGLLEKEAAELLKCFFKEKRAK